MERFGPGFVVIGSAQLPERIAIGDEGDVGVDARRCGPGSPSTTYLGQGPPYSRRDVTTGGGAFATKRSR